MLAKVKIYKGIEFIELDDLPSEQVASFKEWATNEMFIKILIKDKVVGNCIQYKDYKEWYEQFVEKRQPRPVVVLLEKKAVLSKP